MEPPAELRSFVEDRESITISEREYEGTSEIVVDFGPVATEPSVDVVGDTAIVVLDGNHFEFDVPTSADEVTINDGILTIRG